MAEITQAELDTLKEVFSEFKSSGGTVKDFARGLSLAAKEGDTFGNRVKSAGLQVFDGATSFTKSMANGTQGAAAFTGVISATSGGLSTLLKDTNIAGAAISKLGEFSAEYVNRALVQSDALFASFQGLSKVGGAGVDGMKGVFNSLHQFGMTMNQLPQFGALITKNSESLAVMGGTVSEGTKKFATVASSIQQSGLQTQFERMGITVEEQNERTADYLRLQTLTGMGAVKTQAQLNEGAAEYIRQQDRLSRLTGKTADSLAKQEEARLSDERYSALTLELQMKAAAAKAAGDEAGVQAAQAQIDQNKELLDRVPASLKKGMQDLMSGNANSQEGQKILISLPETARMLMSQQAKTGEQFEESMVSMSAEMKAAAERNTGLAKAGVYNKVGADFAGLVAGGKMPTGAAAKLATTEQTTQAAGGGDVDVNNQVALRQAQRATTTAMEELVEKGTGPLLSSLTTLSTKIASVTTAIPGVSQRASLTPTPTPAQLEAGIKAGKTVEEVMKSLARGTAAPASAGYNSDLGALPDSATLKNSWDKFLNAVTGSVEQQAPVDSNGRVIFPSAAGATTSSVPAGPNDRAPVRLEGARPENVQTDTRANSTSSGTTDSLAEGFRALAGSISQQTQSMDDMVDLMRRSLGVQGRILQQSRN